MNATRPGLKRPLLLLAMLLIGLNLRPVLAALGPVLAAIRADLHLSYGQAGLLSTLPVLCMGGFALLAPRWLTRWGFRLGIFLAVVLLGLASLVRIVPSYPALLGSTLLAGAAVALLPPLLNGQTKLCFPDSAARMTVWITTALCAGAGLGAGLSVPLAQWLGWPLALASWCLPAFGAALLWLRVAPNTSTNTADDSHDEARNAASLPWNSVRAWQLIASFGLNASLFFALLAWLAPAYQAWGLSAIASGNLLSVFAMSQAVGAFAMSRGAPVGSDRRPVLALSTGIVCIGMTGLCLAPLSLPYVWAVCVGGGCASVFALQMVMPLDYGESAAEAGAWTAMMSSGGYVISAAGPWMMGWVRDWSGHYDAAFKLLWLVAALSFACIPLLKPRPHAL